MKTFASKSSRQLVLNGFSTIRKALVFIGTCILAQGGSAQCLEANRISPSPAQTDSRASSVKQDVSTASPAQRTISYEEFLEMRKARLTASVRGPRVAPKQDVPVPSEAPTYVEPCYGGGSIVYVTNSLERVEVVGERMQIYEVWTQLTGTYFDRDYMPVEIEAGGNSPTPPTPTTKMQRCLGRKAQCEADAQWDRDNAIQACNESWTNSIRGGTAKALCRQAAQETFKYIRDNTCVANYASCMSDPG